MKKLMILGGSRFALPVIEAAKTLGVYTITCDYIPGNIAHKYSDEYVNVSIVDQEAVLAAAREREIDGIVSFACDPGVVTAAYVAEQMGLPGPGPYGSKGVSRVEDPADLRASIDYALSFSRAKEFIVEDFITQKGYSSDTDSFSVDGELKFVSYNCQHFDRNAENPYTPAAYSWPSSMSAEHQEELTREIQRLIRLLGLKTAIYNIETREGTDGKAYIMELSPRAGGNRLAECLRYATGVDMITNLVKYSVGMEMEEIRQEPYQGCWAEVILHSSREGVFEELIVSDAIRDYVVERDLWIEPGTPVKGFAAANEAIGTLVFRFDTPEQVEDVLGHQEKYIQIRLR